MNTLKIKILLSREGKELWNRNKKHFSLFHKCPLRRTKQTSKNYLISHHLISDVNKLWTQLKALKTFFLKQLNILRQNIVTCLNTWQYSIKLCRSLHWVGKFTNDLFGFLKVKSIQNEKNRVLNLLNTSQIHRKKLNRPIENKSTSINETLSKCVVSSY